MSELRDAPQPKFAGGFLRPVIPAGVTAFPDFGGGPDFCRHVRGRRKRTTDRQSVEWIGSLRSALASGGDSDIGGNFHFEPRLCPAQNTVINPGSATDFVGFDNRDGTRDGTRDMGVSRRVPKSGHGGGETSPFRGMSPLCPDGTGDGTFEAVSRVPAWPNPRARALCPNGNSGGSAEARDGLWGRPTRAAADHPASPAGAPSAGARATRTHRAARCSGRASNSAPFQADGREPARGGAGSSRVRIGFGRGSCAARKAGVDAADAGLRLPVRARDMARHIAHPAFTRPLCRLRFGSAHAGEHRIIRVVTGGVNVMAGDLAHPGLSSLGWGWGLGGARAVGADDAGDVRDGDREHIAVSHILVQLPAARHHGVNVAHGPLAVADARNERLSSGAGFFVGHVRVSLSDDIILPSRHAEVNIKMQSREIFLEVAR